MNELGSTLGYDGTAADAGSEESLLVFVVAGLRVALPVREVLEVAVLGRMVPVPLVPAHLRGVTDWHGYVLPLIDLERLLGLPADAGAAAGPAAAAGGEGRSATTVPPEEGTARMVVVSAAGMRAGLLCNRVLGIVEPLASQRRAPTAVPDPRLRELSRAELTLDAEICSVLDLAALLNAARVAE